MKNLSLPKSKRLTTSSQFKAVLARKLSFSDGLLIMYIAENDCKIARLGIAVNKSVGTSVVRNRLKRLIREAFRQNQRNIPRGFDYLFMFSPAWKDKLSKSPDIDEIVSSSYKRLKLEHVRDSMLALIAKAFKRVR
jgi:ribonuclease P protein component